MFSGSGFVCFIAVDLRVRVVPVSAYENELALQVPVAPCVLGHGHIWYGGRDHNDGDNGESEKHLVRETFSFLSCLPHT
jgi:hypothetical protein